MEVHSHWLVLGIVISGLYVEPWAKSWCSGQSNELSSSCDHPLIVSWIRHTATGCFQTQSTQMCQSLPLTPPFSHQSELVLCCGGRLGTWRHGGSRSRICGQRLVTACYGGDPGTWWWTLAVREATMLEKETSWALLEWVSPGWAQRQWQARIIQLWCLQKWKLTFESPHRLWTGVTLMNFDELLNLTGISSPLLLQIPFWIWIQVCKIARFLQLWW